MTFRCILLTPEQQLIDQQVTQVIVPAHDGLMGILVDRAPVIVKLGIGPLRIDLPDGKKLFYFLDGGVGQMKKNVFTILTSSATPAAEINAQAAMDEYDAALTKPAVSPAEVDERDKTLQRARVKQALSAKPRA
jgi:F-type H+-transporting ATPase subunit epsilon